MLSPLTDDAPTPQQREQCQNRCPHRRHSPRALVAAAGDDEHFAHPADLALTQPRLCAKTRIGRRRQRLPQVQGVLGSELRLIERSEDGVKRNLT